MKLKVGEVRRQKGMTQREAAELLGISRGYLSQIERNKKMPSLTLARNMMHIWGLKGIEDLFNYDD